MNTQSSADLGNDLSILINTSLVDVVTQKIRANIYTGKYEAGKKLIVREIAEEFGVSHTPVKDALNRLVAEGYVEAPPRKSMRVRTYSKATIIDSLLARLMCEVFSAEEIIKAASQHPEICAELQEIIAGLRLLGSQKEKMSYESYVDLGNRFHDCYMRHCNNEKIYTFYRMIDTTRESWFTYLDINHSPLDSNVVSKNLCEHQEIMDAIIALDYPRFIRAVFCHIFRIAEDNVSDDESRKKLEQFQAFREKMKINP